MENSWYNNINLNLTKGKITVNPKDYKFFNVEMIRYAANHTKLFYDKCEICKNNTLILLELSQNYPNLLTTISGRNKFSKNLDKVLSHLRKEHKIYPKGYFTGLYTVFGILAGAIFGLLLWKIKFLALYTSLMITLGLGLIIGWIIGNIKDKRVKKLTE